MKKFFVAICFCLMCGTAWARITPISQYSGSLRQQSSSSPKVRVLSYEEFSDFLEKQPRHVVLMKREDISSSNTSVVPWDRHSKEDDKGIFQKIYDDAISRVASSRDTQRQDVSMPMEYVQMDAAQKQQTWDDGSVPTITVTLPPYNKKAKAPAIEHIPYMMSVVEVLNNGLTRIRETVVVIANGQKLKNGLTKIVPAKVFTTDGKVQTLDYSIVNVSVNNEPIAYHLATNGTNILMVPDDDAPLVPGVYTYNFEYLVDNLLIEGDDAYRMYWNVGGGGWNLVVDRLGATLLLPQKDALLGHNVFFGNALNLYQDSVQIMKNGLLGTSYVAGRPLFVGEGMYLTAEIDKQAIYPFSGWQRFMHSFYDYGDVILSILGGIFIIGSMWLSWRYIRAQKKLAKYTLPKTAMVMRYLLNNKFDSKSVCGFLLEMYKKNIIDIQQAESTILLIKRTDNLKTLDNTSQKALKALFPAHETIFNVNKNTKLVMERFAKILRKGLLKQMKIFAMKLNFGYALMSVLFVLLAEAFIAYFKIASGYVFAVLAVTSLICFCAIWLWNITLPKIIGAAVKLLVADIFALSLIIMSAVVHPLAAVFLLMTIILISVALHFYAKRYGLIQYYINDVKQYRDGVAQNAENIVLGKNFLNYQSAIWALDLENEIKPLKTAEFYKIPVMEEIVKIMGA